MFIDIPLGFICFSRTKVMHMYVFVYFILRHFISMGLPSTWTLYCRSLFLKWEYMIM